MACLKRSNFKYEGLAARGGGVSYDRENAMATNASARLLILATILVAASFSTVFTKTPPGSSLSDQVASPELPAPEFTLEPGSLNGWFTENRGQIENPEIRFFYAGPGYSVAFVRSGYVIRIPDGNNRSSVVNVTFRDAGPVLPEGCDERFHRSSYLLGNHSSDWHTDVRNYGRVIYTGLYPGIDLVFTTTETDLKYDFIIAPGASPERISYTYEGADRIHIDDSGRLRLTTVSGELVEDAPFSYQEKGGETVEIASRYHVDGTTLGFHVEDHDPTLPLIIDPLLYSTFVGGEKADHGNAMTLDSEGNVYVTGETKSPDFPTTPGCYDDSQDEYGEIFVLKLNPDNSQLLFSTFIGGKDRDYGNDITLDSDNNVYITGATSSSDFPTTQDCFDDSYNGNKDAFVVKLNSNGTWLLYASFLGGSAQETGEAIVLDSEREAYVTGATGSSDFPTTPGCYDDSHNGAYDVFALRLSRDASSLKYATFIGGDEEDVGRSIALDLGNNAYIAGWTGSQDFPVKPQGFDFTFNGYHDAFVVKLNPGGSSLRYSTFIGGENLDSGMDLALDRKKNAYVTGTTDSPDFPTTPAAFDESHNGGYDVFVCKLDPDGGELLYSSFVGGNRSEKYDVGIALDPEGSAYITGDTHSPDFPTTTGCYDDSHNGEGDVFVCKLAGDGSSLVYSTFIGGPSNDWGLDITLDSENNAFLTGDTSSPTFPVTPYSYDEEQNGGADIFVCMLNPGRPVASIDSVSSRFLEEGGRVWFHGNGTDDERIEGYLWTSGIDGVLSRERGFNCSNLSNGTHEISFKVVDNHGIWSNEVAVNVTVNGIPRARNITIQPQPAHQGKRAWFYGVGIDDGSITRYLWRSSLDGVLYNGGEAEFYHGQLSWGSHSILFKVQDEHGAWSEELTMPLRVNKKPEAVIDPIVPNPALDTHQLRFRGHFTDDGTVARYVWRSSINGEFYNGTKKEFYNSNLSKGVHDIHFRIQDNDGLWSEEATTSLIVHQRPRATIRTISPNPCLDVDRVTFAGEGTGDTHIARYVWSSNIDGELSNDTKPGFSMTRLSAGNHTIILQVQDSYGAWSKDSVEHLTVDHFVPSNKLPTVTITSPKNGSELRGVIRFSGNAFDEDDGVTGVELSFNGGEWVAATGTVFWSYQWDSTQEDNGECTVRVRSFDGRNHSEEAAWWGMVANPVEEKDGDGGNLLLIWVFLLLVGAVGGGVIIVKKGYVPVFVFPLGRFGDAKADQRSETVTATEPSSSAGKPKRTAGDKHLKPPGVRKRCQNCGQALRIRSAKRPLVIVCPGCQKKYILSR